MHAADYSNKITPNDLKDRVGGLSELRRQPENRQRKPDNAMYKISRVTRFNVVNKLGLNQYPAFTRTAFSKPCFSHRPTNFVDHLHVNNQFTCSIIVYIL